MSKTYCLTMSEEQAELISSACDFYGRIILGQFDRITEECLEIREPIESYCKDRDMANDLLRLARRICYPDLIYPGASYGIGHSEKADRLYDIHQVLRNKVAWSVQPTGSLGVHHDPPMRFSDLPLPTCTITED